MKKLSDLLVISLCLGFLSLGVLWRANHRMPEVDQTPVLTKSISNGGRRLVTTGSSGLMVDETIPVGQPSSEFTLEPFDDTNQDATVQAIQISNPDNTLQIAEGTELTCVLSCNLQNVTLHLGAKEGSNPFSLYDDNAGFDDSPSCPVQVIHTMATTTSFYVLVATYGTKTLVDGEVTCTTPSEEPSESPSEMPSSTPSAIPSATPSFCPSTMPSSAPSLAPSASLFPSNVPSTSPSVQPSPDTPTVEVEVEATYVLTFSNAVGEPANQDTITAWTGVLRNFLNQRLPRSFGGYARNSVAPELGNTEFTDTVWTLQYQIVSRYSTNDPPLREQVANAIDGYSDDELLADSKEIGGQFSSLSSVESIEVA